MTMRKLAIEAAVMALAALFLAVLGPFGTFGAPFGERLASWALFALGGYCCFRPTIAAGRVLAEQGRMPLALGIVIACMVAAIPTTLIVAGVASGLKLGDVRLAQLAGLYPLVMIIGLAVTGLQMLIHRLPPQAQIIEPPIAEPPLSEPPPSPAPPLPEPPPALKGDILYITNEDHYVRVHRHAGSELVLMRMRDAVAALGHLDGARVHRGCWVARAAVAQVNRQGRAISLTLVDGRTVPVSRAMVLPLREAGWL